MRAVLHSPLAPHQSGRLTGSRAVALDEKQKQRRLLASLLLPRDYEQIIWEANRTPCRRSRPSLRSVRYHFIIDMGLTATHSGTATGHREADARGSDVTKAIDAAILAASGRLLLLSIERLIRVAIR